LQASRCHRRRHTLALLQYAAHDKVQLRRHQHVATLHGAAKCDDTRSLINHATATRRTPLEQGVATVKTHGGCNLLIVVYAPSLIPSYFFSRIHRQRIIVISRDRIGTIFSYNPNEIDSRWTQAGKPAEHNPKALILK
jgi:hypothetical protein